MFSVLHVLQINACKDMIVSFLFESFSVNFKNATLSTECLLGKREKVCIMPKSLCSAKRLSPRQRHVTCRFLNEFQNAPMLTSTKA